MYKAVDGEIRVGLTDHDNGNNLVIESDGSINVNSTSTGDTLISTSNSTTLTLASTQTYTGTWEEVPTYSSVSVLVIIDTSGGEKCTLSMELSPDTVSTRSKSVEVSFGNSSVHTLSLVSRYFRISIDADLGTSVTGNVQTIYSKHRTQGLMSFVGESINDQNDCTLNRSVITANNALDAYANVESDSFNRLKVAVPQTPFGEVIVTQANAQLVTSFLYDHINDQLYETFVGNAIDTPGATGTVTSSNSLVNLTLDTNAYSYATIRTKRTLKYFPGSINTVRFSVAYNTPVASSGQRAGLGTSSGELSFGYDGTSFGVLRAYGGENHEVHLTITAAATGAETATVTLNGTAYTVTLSNAGGDIGFTCHEIEIQAGWVSPAPAYVTAWNVEHVGDEVHFIFRGVGPKSGTYSFSSTGAATGSFATITTGVSQTTSWTAEADFNINPTLSQSLTKTYGNVYQISYTWHGYGAIQYSVVNPSTGNAQPLHVEYYNDTDTDPWMKNPHMPVQFSLFSAGSTTAMTMTSASWGGYTNTAIPVIREPRFAVAHEKINVSTETVILALRSRFTMNGVVNQSRSFLTTLSVAVDGTKAVIIKVIRNPTSISADSTSDFTDYEYVNQNNSLLLLDTVADTYSGGTEVLEFYLSKSAQEFIRLEYGEYSMYRGDEYIVTAQSGANSDIDVAITYVDDF